MRSLKTNKVFVSAFRGLNEQEDLKNHEYASNLLRREGISFREVVGRFDGQSEKTFLLESTSITGHEANLAVAFSVARLFKQHAILEVHNDDAAVIHYPNAATESHRVGVLTEVSPAEATESKAYTFDPVSDRYFLVK